MKCGLRFFHFVEKLQFFFYILPDRIYIPDVRKCFTILTLFCLEIEAEFLAAQHNFHRIYFLFSFFNKWFNYPKFEATTKDITANPLSDNLLILLPSKLEFWEIVQVSREKDKILINCELTISLSHFSYDDSSILVTELVFYHPVHLHRPSLFLLSSSFSFSSYYCTISR